MYSNEKNNSFYVTGGNDRRNLPHTYHRHIADRFRPDAIAHFGGNDPVRRHNARGHTGTYNRLRPGKISPALRLLDIPGGASASLLAAVFAYLIEISHKTFPGLLAGRCVFNGLIVGMVIKITSGSEVLYWAVAGEIAWERSHPATFWESPLAGYGEKRTEPPAQQIVPPPKTTSPS